MEKKQWHALANSNYEDKGEWMDKLRDAWHETYGEPFPADVDYNINEQLNIVLMRCSSADFEKIFAMNAKI